MLKSIGDVHKDQDQLNEAGAAYEQAVDHIRHVADAKADLATLLVDLGRIQRRLGIRQDEEREKTKG